MPDEIRLDVENQLMRVQFTSDSTVEDWKSALEEVESLSEETGIRRVLVDVRDQTELASNLELFDFASQLPCSMAFAVLVKIHLKEHYFIESVAINRGIAVKDFELENKAIEWLQCWPNTGVYKDKK